MNARRNRPSRSRKSGSRAPRPETAAERHARDEDRYRRMAYLNLFWMNCTNKACRRVKNCAGDPVACFRRRWDPLPEEEKQWRRDWLLELHRTRDMDRAMAHADARAAERKRLDEEFAKLRAG